MCLSLRENSYVYATALLATPMDLKRPRTRTSFLRCTSTTKVPRSCSAWRPCRVTRHASSWILLDLEGYALCRALG